MFYGRQSIRCALTSSNSSNMSNLSVIFYHLSSRSLFNHITYSFLRPTIKDACFVAFLKSFTLVCCYKSPMFNIIHHSSFCIQTLYYFHLGCFLALTGHIISALLNEEVEESGSWRNEK